LLEIRIEEVFTFLLKRSSNMQGLILELRVLVNGETIEENPLDQNKAIPL
jgi:hypothetical protein